MSGKTILEIESPKTQSAEAVKALATYLNRPIEAGVLDLGAVKLVKSNRGDCFYTVTAKACSCPSHVYRGGPCKHQRLYFPQPAKTSEAKAQDSIKPVGKWPHGFNGPVNMPEGDLLKEMEAQGYAMSFEADY